MASELSELRAELWRTRDSLERIKSRPPPSVGRPSRRLFGGRSHAGGNGVERGIPLPLRPDDQDGIKGLKLDRSGTGGIRSEPTSPPLSAMSSESDTSNGRSRSGSRSTRSRSFNEEFTAEETLCNMELEGAAFKNWTEEASSIAVRLIEEVKTLRWEKVAWGEREAAAERASAELRERTEVLEQRLLAAEANARQTQDALLRVQQAEREQATATARAEAELRVAQERSKELQARVEGLERGDIRVGVGCLKEELRREKEGADALQRRLDEARAAVAKHDGERKEWHESRAKLEDLRRSWEKQLKKVPAV